MGGGRPSPAFRLTWRALLTAPGFIGGLLKPVQEQHFYERAEVRLALLELDPPLPEVLFEFDPDLPVSHRLLRPLEDTLEHVRGRLTVTRVAALAHLLAVASANRSPRSPPRRAPYRSPPPAPRR